MNAQSRTLQDLRLGMITIQVDKGGRIHHLWQPQIGWPSVEIIDKEMIVQFKDEIETLREKIDKLELQVETTNALLRDVY